MQLFTLFTDSNTLHFSGVTHPSSEVQTVCAAYGTGMLIYVVIGNTIWSMGLWLMSYNIMWMFIGCELRDLAPLSGSLSVFSDST